MMNIILILSLVFLIHEIRTIIWPLKYDKQISKIKKNLKDGYLNPNDRPFMIFNFIYFIWSVLGLLTPYWVIFLLFIIFSFLSTKYLLKTEDTINRIRLRRFDSVVSIIIITALLLTHYL